MSKHKVYPMPPGDRRHFGEESRLRYDRTPLNLKKSITVLVGAGPAVGVRVRHLVGNWEGIVVERPADANPSSVSADAVWILPDVCAMFPKPKPGSNSLQSLFQDFVWDGKGDDIPLFSTP